MYAMQSISSELLTTVDRGDRRAECLNDPHPQQMIAAADQRLNVSAHLAMKNRRLVAA